MLRVLVDGTSEFREALARLARRGDADLARVEPRVREILDVVRREGDAAVHRITHEVEGRRDQPLVRVDYAGDAALARLPAAERQALELAASRIRSFHERQKDVGFRYDDEAGVSLGVRTLPLGRVGVYAPGGKARYPSSVLMSAIPASVAGVTEILLATPLRGDASDDAMLAAAHLAGVRAVVDAGGAQAIAALAFGTESVPRVDKIVGPGNLYVACAKKLVFGTVAIEGIAGPSEILVVADEAADPGLVAADLLSQAEHDESAYPLLACLSEEFARAVVVEIEAQLASLPRASIARAALETNGHAFVTGTKKPGEEPTETLARAANELAVEHVALHVGNPEDMLARIRRVGAAFMGPLTAEAAGDYLAGPSHVLPTGGAVRFASPLGVYDFITRTSVIRYTPEALARHAEAICALARLEGLEGHARAVLLRARRK